MTFHHAGLHHYRKCKKACKVSGNPVIGFFDKFMYAVAIIFPLTTIPQIVTIWTHKSARDISIFTWGAYTFSATCWLIYAIIHKEKVLIINSALWVLLEFTVVVGIIIYG